ncbi:hypothetical protein SAMN05216257_1183 [Meinhardsimonia xiamenensis]|jgi:hypothetical protein|uniref:Uncharacterized protein n=1 Tax=Meinhardsimonia xiamenensis TaxID=990712 RepID=A0A1G9HLW5_9RHOB|nr:DUF6880 family protein [Meinhardsimonia xiamenensis]PRX27410.1 hypothetical protein LV81_03054 [Meinhardsimonia xiamenensis]SDL13957.1 hypothetical protein SAMN05216257_1183 [Meinhardsimonia xiamenensis]
MASKTTLNAKNLEALGAARLAQLLVEISTGNAAAKRKLRLALAGAQGPKEAAREITKRLTSIARARSFVTWKNRKALVDDLETQRRAIVEQIAPADPQEALTLMWRFMGLATPVFERCDDSSGTVIDIFHQACADLGALAKVARPEPKALARQVLDALQDNGYGQYDDLIALMAPALGPDGLEHLKELVEELGRTPVPVPPKSEWEEVGWGSGGPRHAHEMAERARQSTVSMALKDIADALGDVDGFIAQYEPETRRVPKIAAEIAQRLLGAGRAEDALGFIERAEFGNNGWIPREWTETRLAVLEALGRLDEAQALRWETFERTLSVEHLRAYLKRLPDFDDIEAEERAMAQATAHPSLLAALQFFLDWPALDRAAELLVARHSEIDGDHYEYLVPAAEALSERHPLAATLALRAMIDFTLTKARSKRYRHAADHLTECARLAEDIQDFGAFETHEAYVARLKKEHGRKFGFWSLAEG